MLPRSRALRCGSLATAIALTGLASSPPAAAEILYTLQTRCSLNGATPVPCTVEAINQETFTLYRHRIGADITTLRISDAPLRMALWDRESKGWRSLTTASARFSTNTVCFNDRQLCVVNPNYLNSVRQDNPKAMAQRDVVKVHFGADGRINASCYDEGCEVTLK